MDRPLFTSVGENSKGQDVAVRLDLSDLGDTLKIVVDGGFTQTVYLEPIGRG